MDCLWKKYTDQAELPKGEVHIWCANLEPAADQLTMLQKTLTAVEEQRAERFRFWRHKRRFIAARGILRILLGQYLGTLPIACRYCV